MVIDPRTLRPVATASECHLIPECFGVSNKTVLLDRLFDNKIGEKCDNQLYAYYQLCIGEKLDGHFVIEGGPKALAGSWSPLTQQFSITQRVRVPKGRQKRWTADLHRRALGIGDDGRVKIKEFVTPAVNLLKARLSMVHSAVLILYYLDRKEIYGPDFNQARALLTKACMDNLDKSDLPLIEEMTPEFGKVHMSSEKIKRHMTLSRDQMRWYYDPKLDIGDGVLDDFPKNCVAETGQSLTVRLPYGKGLRGTVRFRLSRDAT